METGQVLLHARMQKRICPVSMLFEGEILEDRLPARCILRSRIARRRGSGGRELVIGSKRKSELAAFCEAELQDAAEAAVGSW